MFGLAAVDDVHREGVPEDEGHALRRAEISEPVPDEEAFTGRHQTVPIGRNGLQKWFRSGLHMVVEHDFPIVAHHTDVHTAGGQVDATVQGGLVGVESPEVSSSCVRSFFPRPADPWGMWWGRPQLLSRACRRRGKPRRFPLRFPTRLERTAFGFNGKKKVGMRPT